MSDVDPKPAPSPVRFFTGQTLLAELARSDRSRLGMKIRAGAEAGQGKGRRLPRRSE